MPDYAYYYSLIAGYSIWLSQLLLVVASVFLHKSGKGLPASLIGIPTCAAVLTSIVSNLTTTDELVEMTDEYGDVIGYQMDSNFWSAIQYPTYLISVFVASVGLVLLARILYRDANK